jgi:hypothetical protein
MLADISGEPRAGSGFEDETPDSDFIKSGRFFPDAPAWWGRYQRLVGLIRGGGKELFYPCAKRYIQTLGEQD